MNGKQAERKLAIFYLSSLILSSISTIFFTIIWKYWSETLNDCIEIDCGCILYSVNSYKNFRGRDVSFCKYPIYSLIPSMTVGLILGVYHAYRSFIHRNLDDPQISQVVGEIDGDNCGNVFIVGPKKRSPCRVWWIPGFLAAIICLISLAHAYFILDGYYQTCDEYRKYIIQTLGSTGREVQAIHNRLSCNAIFDYMDYLHPDNYYWRRGVEIYTGYFFQITIVTSWLNFLSWIIIFVINIHMARQKKNKFRT
ncbi:hypothetical protein HCN44_002776 [Aphidius gifuensis]|uniref:Uncharacterized protein n=1 Tax=Aphidius gifuensis TaxID=684658 RepID=A0A835CNV7_APHGI|nr:uncharacterized protein LOC122854388 [Aphidius gifuensis]KAF7991214.1 hypothetical protein HCN44_002776 [Aphidius gifuensis]